MYKVPFLFLLTLQTLAQLLGSEMPDVYIKVLWLLYIRLHESILFFNKEVIRTKKITQQRTRFCAPKIYMDFSNI